MSRKQAPYLTWWGATTPTTGVTLSAFTWVGIAFQVTIPLRLYGFRWYAALTNPVDAVVCWDIGVSHPILTAVRFKYAGTPIADNWTYQYVRPHELLEVGHTYYACVQAWVQYFRTPSASAHLPVTRNNIIMMQGFQTTAANPAEASITTNTNANGLDIIAQDPDVVGG